MALTNHGLYIIDNGLRVAKDSPPLKAPKQPWWPPGWGPGRRVAEENDIFELLQLEYRHPEDRNC